MAIMKWHLPPQNSLHEFLMNYEPMNITELTLIFLLSYEQGNYNSLSPVGQKTTVNTSNNN